MGQADQDFLADMYEMASALTYWSDEASRARKAGDVQSAALLDADVTALTDAMDALGRHHRLGVWADLAAELGQPVREEEFEAAMDGELDTADKPLGTADAAVTEYLLRAGKQQAPAPVEPTDEAVRLLTAWNRTAVPTASRPKRRAARQAFLDSIADDVRAAWDGHPASDSGQPVESAEAIEATSLVELLSLDERSAAVYTGLAAGASGWHPPSMWLRDLHAEETTRAVEESFARAAQLVGFAETLEESARELEPGTPLRSELAAHCREFRRRADKLVRDLVVPWATEMALTWALQEQTHTSYEDVERLLQQVGTSASEASGLGTPGRTKLTDAQLLVRDGVNAFLRDVPTPAVEASYVDTMRRALTESRTAVAEAVFQHAEATRNGNDPTEVLPAPDAGLEIVYTAMRRARLNLAPEAAGESSPTASAEAGALKQAGAVEETVRALEGRHGFLRTMNLLESAGTQLTRQEEQLRGTQPEQADRLKGLAQEAETAWEACVDHYWRYVRRDVATNLGQPERRAKYQLEILRSRARVTSALAKAAPAITTYEQMIEHRVAAPPPEVTGADEQMLIGWQEEFELRERQHDPRAKGVASPDTASRPTRSRRELIRQLRTRTRNTPDRDVVAPAPDAVASDPAREHTGTAPPLSIADWAQVTYRSIAELAVQKNPNSLWALRLDDPDARQTAAKQVLRAAHLTGFALAFAELARDPREAGLRVRTRMNRRSEALQDAADGLFRDALAPWATWRALRRVTELAEGLPPAEAKRLVNLVADSAVQFAHLGPLLSPELSPPDVISARATMNEFVQNCPPARFRTEYARAALSDALQPGRVAVSDAMVAWAVRAASGAESTGAETSPDSGVDLLRSAMLPLARSESPRYADEAKRHVGIVVRGLGHGMATRLLDQYLGGPGNTVAADRGRGRGAGGLSVTDGRRRPGHQRLLAASPLFA